MVRTIRIIGAVAILAIAFLMYLASEHYRRAEYWRTKPMRDKRHDKKAKEQEVIDQIKIDWPKMSDDQKLDAIEFLRLANITIEGINDKPLDNEERP